MVLSKEPETLGQRIRRALEAGPCVGQLDLGRRVLGTDYSLEQWQEFSEALRGMRVVGMVVESRNQVPGTGHEAIPWYEYTYSLAACVAQRR